ncbi:hypothetical protein A6A06_36175 [Streptomyces sp. CB02923]|uniref:hypothetical protein n=1 Tax=Streptomyces sp. CB02923 TaxID=1718985 RepID=UPI000939DEE8|nr:hypothetical protein [Streptomyces sp. CB02923]OKI07139.1 hypothetical protein A6A06_36175 [Streptomyces sp. CB02923]
MGSYANSKYAPQDKCYAIENTTKFHNIDFESLKAMVANAKPDDVAGVGHAWEQVHNQLVSDNGGGIKAMFDKAINEVLEHWEGDAAKAFRTRAEKISKNIENGASYAKVVGEGMKRSSEALGEYKKHLDGMEWPSWGSRAWDWATDSVGRDDSKANSALAGGKSAAQVVEDNEDNLSAGKETQLKAAATMEYLGAAYRTNAAAIGKPPNAKFNDDTDIPPPNTGPAVPPVLPLPAAVAKKPKPLVGGPGGSLGKGPGFSSDGLQAPKTDGIHGGVGSVQPGKGGMPSNIGTGLDSFNPPSTSGPGGGLTSTGPSGGGPGLGNPGGGGQLNGGPGGGGHLGGGPGMPGIAGGGKAGGGPGGTSASRIGGPGSGSGSGTGGARGGRQGMPGMGGAAGAGAGRGGGAAAGRGGALARQKGGVVGSTSGSKTGGGAQGGAGLHRSRGGAQAGTGGNGRRPMGMAGAPGAHGAKGNDKGENGQRPDYLVEDEETWTPERNVAPKVIE